MNENRDVLRPSKRKEILYKKIREYTHSGYKMVSQKNFSSTLERPYAKKKVLGIRDGLKWMLFDIPSLIEHIKSEDIPESKIDISIDMYGNITTKEF